MTRSSDIVNLFARFGGAPDQYQELGKTSSLDKAQNRWPLLQAIDAQDQKTGARPLGKPSPEKASPFMQRVSRNAQVSPPATPLEKAAAPVASAPTAPAPQLAAKLGLSTLASRAPRAEPAPQVARGAPLASGDEPLSHLFARLAEPSAPAPSAPAKGLLSSLRRLRKA